MKDKKILIVDFDNETSENLSHYLSEEGFEVSVAKDGQSGLEKFKSEKPDLIVLEPMLPKVHGFDLCRNLFQNANRKTPIVFTTEFYGEEQCRRETNQSEVNVAFFKKPYRSQDIHSSILKLLGNGTEEKAEDKTETRDEAEDREPLPLHQPPEAPPDDLENLLAELQPSSEADVSEEEKRAVLPGEIDKMLKDTLSEFGMTIGLDESDLSPDTKASEPGPKLPEPSFPPDEEKIEGADEDKKKLEQEEREDKGISAAPAIEAMDALAEGEKLTEADAEPTAGERPDAFENRGAEEALEDTQTEGLFSGFGEETLTAAPQSLSEKFLVVTTLFKKKPALKIVLPLVLAGLLAGGSALIILTSKKGNSSPQQKASQSFPAAQKDGKGTQLASFSTSLLPNLGETQEGKSSDSDLSVNPSTSPPEEQATAEVETPASSQQEKPPATNPPPPPTTLSSEYTEPVIPNSILFQEIDINPEKMATTDQLDIQQASAMPGGLNPPEEKKESLQSTPANDRPKTKIGDIIALGLVDTPPILIKRIQPRYPPSALSQGIEENVMVNALISENGEVEKTVVLRGGKSEFGFDEAAQKAVSQWRFKPAVKDGVKVKVWKPIMIAFKNIKD